VVVEGRVVVVVGKGESTIINIINSSSNKEEEQEQGMRGG
jgi:hypothetical protein